MRILWGGFVVLLTACEMPTPSDLPGSGLSTLECGYAARPGPEEVRLESAERGWCVHYEVRTESFSLQPEGVSTCEAKRRGLKKYVALPGERVNVVGPPTVTELDWEVTGNWACPE